VGGLWYTDVICLHSYSYPFLIHYPTYFTSLFDMYTDPEDSQLGFWGTSDLFFCMRVGVCMCVFFLLLAI